MTLRLRAALSAVTVLCAVGIHAETPAAGTPAAGAGEQLRMPFGGKGEERPKGPTTITAKEAMFDNRIHTGTFSGEVVVEDPEFGLSCNSLSVYLKKPPERNANANGGADAKPAANPPAQPKGAGEDASGIDKAVAEGSVIITADKKDANGKMQRYTGRGEKATFDNEKGILTLSGWPQISQSIGGNAMKQITAREKGCIIILDRAGRIEVHGYHTSTIQDASSLNEKQR